MRQVGADRSVRTLPIKDSDSRKKKHKQQKNTSSGKTQAAKNPAGLKSEKVHSRRRIIQEERIIGAFVSEKNPKQK